MTSTDHQGAHAAPPAGNGLDYRTAGVDIEAVRAAGQAAGEAIWSNWQDWDPDGRTAEQMSPMSFKLIN